LTSYGLREFTKLNTELILRWWLNQPVLSESSAQTAKRSTSLCPQFELYHDATKSNFKNFYVT